MTDDLAPLPERVRQACSTLSERADLVRIDEGALDRLAGSLDPAPPEPYEEERWSGPAPDRAAAIVAWNAVNFGSGWFPHVRKLPGRSGARTLATRWHDHVDRHGVPDAAWFADVTVEQVAAVFDQPLEGEVVGLLDAFGDAWRELGRHLLGRHGGSSAAMVEAAGRSGAALAEELGELASWRDVHVVDGLRVPLFKRAQIVVSHLAGAGLGPFDDLHRLTAFADNLVPHVLRVDGVLTLAPELRSAIEAGELVAEGSEAEVELRAAAVDAVERLAPLVGATPAALDTVLWTRGGGATYKATPRHRTRTVSY